MSPLEHGGRATVALAPAMGASKRELCRRLGVRYADLTAAGKEAITNYARATTKLEAMDRFFRTHTVVNDAGEPSPALASYWTGLNTANRALGRVLDVLQALAAADDKYDAAVQALIAEGRKTRAGRQAGDS
jgi:hypothetical protein